MRYKQTILFFFIFVTISYAQDINIGLFYNWKVRSIVSSTTYGAYRLETDNGKTLIINPQTIIYISAFNNKVQTKTRNGIWGAFDKIRIIGLKSFNTFRFKATKPGLIPREYEGNFSIKVINTYLKIVNTVNLESYIAGVVESEGGAKASREYYKTQAILCRTYALENFHKHDKEGFNLCDDVHCQSYKSRAKKNDIIVEATSITRGLIIVDTSLSLITAAFYSNSGGMTSASELVWQQSRSYLKSVVDSFSIGGNNYSWTKKIALSSWKAYLKRNGFRFNNSQVKGEDFIKKIYSRRKYYVFKKDSIPFTRIRKAFKLKSAFFSIDYKDGYITLRGKGYGHGVGLSQEGAMKMSNKGYNYKEIIKFYYKNVFIVSLRALQFFNM